MALGSSRICHYQLDYSIIPAPRIEAKHPRIAIWSHFSQPKWYDELLLDGNDKLPESFSYRNPETNFGIVDARILFNKE